jgi:Domain of unknown function (DUF4412)
VKNTTIARSLLALLLALASAVVTPAQTRLFEQDLTVHQSTTGSGMGMGSEDKGQQKSATYFSGTSMKWTGAVGTDMIVRYDQGKIITVDHKKKTYTEMTLDQLQQKINEAAKTMNENKEQMEALRKVMGQSFGPISVTKEGPGETIAGYATEKYLVKGPMEMQIWAAPDLKIPGAYYDIMKLNVPQNPLFDMGKMYEEMKKINGLGLKTIMTMNVMGRSMTTTTVVTDVQKGTIPASTFEVPAGYKAVAAK